MCYWSCSLSSTAAQDITDAQKSPRIEIPSHGIILKDQPPLPRECALCRGILYLQLCREEQGISEGLAEVPGATRAL